MFLYLLWLVILIVPVVFGIYLAVYLFKHNKFGKKVDPDLNSKKGLGAH